MSQAQVAALTGLSRAQIGNLERGRCKPSRRTMRDLVWALDATGEELFPPSDQERGAV